MNTSPTAFAFALRYDSLYNVGRWVCFPCDERGTIDLDALPLRARSNDLATEALVGREFAFPVVEPARAS